MLGLDINPKQIERVCTFYGNLLYESQYETPVKNNDAGRGNDGNRYVLMDGSFVQIRHRSLSEPEQKAANGRDVWKEVKLGRIVNEQHIVKRVSKDRSVVTKSDYVVHLGEAERFFSILREAINYKDSECLIFICDGAKWIWKWINETYPDATQILDYFHAKEHLCDYAKIYIKDTGERKEWIQCQDERIMADNVEEVLIELLIDIESNTLGKVVKDQAIKLYNYFDEHKNRMRYKTYRKRGLEIGSGAVESAHRTIIQQRAKLSGQRWTMKGVQSIISLRAAYLGGRWQELLKFIRSENG